MSRCPRSNADAESDGQIVGGFSDIDCSGNLTIGSIAGGSGVLSRSELGVDKLLSKYRYEQVPTTQR